MRHQSVLTLAPLRISFLGGGTDLPDFYNVHTGKVVSAAINKYVYVHIKRHDPLFQERYRISYSQIEYADSRDQIQNGIAAGAPESESWRAAFGLMVTIVWLYMEVLRVLSILRGND